MPGIAVINAIIVPGDILFNNVDINNTTLSELRKFLKNHISTNMLGSLNFDFNKAINL